MVKGTVISVFLAFLIVLVSGAQAEEECSFYNSPQVVPNSENILMWMSCEGNLELYLWTESQYLNLSNTFSADEWFPSASPNGVYLSWQRQDLVTHERSVVIYDVEKQQVANVLSGYTHLSFVTDHIGILSKDDNLFLLDLNTLEQTFLDKGIYAVTDLVGRVAYTQRTDDGDFIKIATVNHGTLEVVANYPIADDVFSSDWRHVQWVGNELVVAQSGNLLLFNPEKPVPTILSPHGVAQFFPARDGLVFYYFEEDSWHVELTKNLAYYGNLAQESVSYKPATQRLSGPHSDTYVNWHGYLASAVELFQ